MKKSLIALLGALALAGMAGPARSEGFLLGPETAGYKAVLAEGSDLTVRLRTQFRLDVGDLLKENLTAPARYEWDQDIYLRRLRLELTGNLGPGLRANVTFSGDGVGQTGKANSVGVITAWFEYAADPALVVKVGKDYLPFSYNWISTSAKMLILDYAVTSTAASALFNDYYQPTIGVRGTFAGGMFNYQVAFGDGWQNGEAAEKPVSAGPFAKFAGTVFKGGMLTAVRLEFSPPGLIQKAKGEVAMGQTTDLAIGLDYASQTGIRFADNGVFMASTYASFKEKRALTGVDVSAHWKGLSALAEYDSWEISNNDAAVRATRKPKGWFLQAGWLFQGVNLEPCFRYEDFDQDSELADKHQKVTTLGVNWYLKGNSVKVGFNGVNTRYDKKADGRLANADSRTVYELQTQLWF